MNCTLSAGRLPDGLDLVSFFDGLVFFCARFSAGADHGRGQRRQFFLLQAVISAASLAGELPCGRLTDRIGVPPYHPPVRRLFLSGPRFAAGGLSDPQPAPVRAGGGGGGPRHQPGIRHLGCLPLWRAAARPLSAQKGQDGKLGHGRLSGQHPGVCGPVRCRRPAGPAGGDGVRQRRGLCAVLHPPAGDSPPGAGSCPHAGRPGPSCWPAGRPGC